MPSTTRGDVYSPGWKMLRTAVFVLTGLGLVRAAISATSELGRANSIKVAGAGHESADYLEEAPDPKKLQESLKDKVFLPNPKGFNTESSYKVLNDDGAMFIINPKGCHDTAMHEIAKLLGLNAKLPPSTVLELDFPVPEIGFGSNVWPTYRVHAVTSADGNQHVRDADTIRALSLTSSVRPAVKEGHFYTKFNKLVTDPQLVYSYLEGDLALFKLFASLNKLAAVGVGDVGTNPENVMQHRATKEFVFPDLDSFYRPNVDSLKSQVEDLTGVRYDNSFLNKGFMTGSLLILQDLVRDMKLMIESEEWQQAKERKLKIFEHDPWEKRDHEEGFADVEKYINDLFLVLPKISDSISNIRLLEGDKDSPNGIKAVVEDLKIHTNPFTGSGAIKAVSEDLKIHTKPFTKYGEGSDLPRWFGKGNYCVVVGFHVEVDNGGNEKVFATIEDVNHGLSPHLERITKELHPASPDANIAIRYFGGIEQRYHDSYPFTILPVSSLPQYLQKGVSRVRDLSSAQRNAITGKNPDIAEANNGNAMSGDEICKDAPSPEVVIGDLSNMVGGGKGGGRV